MSVSTFEQVAELASQLPAVEQLKLVAQIGERLQHLVTKAPSMPPHGSADAILRAVHEPPHLAPGDLDELERAIAAGRLPVRQDGIFDRGGAR
jgi:hypothetical protein